MTQWEAVNFTVTHTSASVQCVCGEIFHASGRPAVVARKQRAWDAKHRACVERKREGQKVFWLSFCDSARPEGQQFLGACLIEVTAEEADAAAFDVLLRFPFAQPHAEWLAAAVTKAHQLGCNPGGEVASAEMPVGHPNLSFYPFGVLMDRATVEAIDRRIAESASPEDRTP